MGGGAGSCRNEIADGLRRHGYAMNFIVELPCDDFASLRWPGLIHRHRRKGWAAVIRQASDVICERNQPAGNPLASPGSSLKRSACSGAVAGFYFLFVWLSRLAFGVARPAQCERFPNA